jgi:MFS family permease
VTGKIRIEQVMVLAALLGIVNAFDMPVRQTFVMEMVGRADLMPAIAWNSAAFNTARIVGPAIGGILIAGIGVGPVFLLNAASFLAVLAALALIREDRLYARPEASARQGLWGSLREGLREVRRARVLHTAVLLVAGVATFGLNLQVILSTMARDVFRIGSQGFGVLMAAAGIGSVLAGLNLAWRGRVNTRRTLLLGGAGVGVLGILFALSPRWNLLPLSVLLLLGLGFSAITLTATANTTVQQRAPEALRGRVLSIYLTAFASSVPIGGLFAGSLARWRGAPTAALIGGIVSLGVVLWAAVHLRRADDVPAAGRDG